MRIPSVRHIKIELERRMMFLSGGIRDKIHLASGPKVYQNMIFYGGDMLYQGEDYFIQGTRSGRFFLLLKPRPY